MEPMILKLSRRLAALLIAFTFCATAAQAQYPPESAAPREPAVAAEHGEDNSPAEAPSQSANRSREVAESFARTGVYVSPDMRERVQTADIESAVANASFPVKVAVVGALPSRVSDVGQLSLALHRQLGLNDGLMIVVCDRPRGLGLYGGDLDKVALNDIYDRTRKTLDSEGYAAGVGRVISLVREERARRAAASRNLLMILVGVPAVLLFFGARRSKRARVRDAGAARTLAEAEAERLRAQGATLASDMEDAIALETDIPRRTQLEAAREKMRHVFGVALEPMRSAHTAAQWDAARAALRAAEEEMRGVQLLLAQTRAARSGAASPPPAPAPAPGAAPSVWADSDAEIPPLGADLPGAREDFALDFFTSQPVRRDEMVPVEIELGGRQRRVWASRESAARVEQGDLSIAASQDGDTARPWFETQGYNPWLEVGASVLPMMAMQLLLGGLLHGSNRDDY